MVQDEEEDLASAPTTLRGNNTKQCIVSSLRASEEVRTARLWGPVRTAQYKSGNLFQVPSLMRKDA